MLSVAVAGTGFMGKTHLGVYLKLKGVKVAALLSRKDIAENFLTLNGGGNIESSAGTLDLSATKLYTDYDEMLTAGGFDFVDICLPTHLHHEYAIRALDSGYHVFCEKPIALTLREADSILQKVEETGKLFTVGHCLRYFPAYIAMKHIIDQGRYGQVRYAEFARFSYPPSWGKNEWQLDGTKSGGAALDLHIHDVDMILFLFGKPKRVRSSGLKGPDGSIDHISTIYQFEDKVVQSTAGWMCTESFGFNMRAFLVLERACIELDYAKQPVVTVFPAGEDKFALSYPEEDGFFYELRDFIEAIEQGELSGIVTPESAAESLKLCLAEILSVNENREICYGG